VKSVARNVDGGQFRVADLNALLVLAVVDSGVDLQARGGRRAGDQVDDDLEAFERLAAPLDFRRSGGGAGGW
jgi:hypothetical protein